MAKLKVTDSPRLYLSAESAANLADRLHSPFLRQQAEQVIRDANWLTRAEPYAEGQTPYGQAARVVQSHLDCLTAAWILTRKARYRRAAMTHLGGLMNWGHISCEARETTPPETELPFCLSYGEQSTAIGLMYDHFRPDLTSAEQKVFFDVIDRFHLKEAVKCLTSPPWWAFKSWSNWNGVCSGGMGIMALAFYTDRPEAPQLIPFVEKSLAEYFRSYVDNGGGCHEGTGYWNYGMNYAMRYLLSWENATGRKHRAFRIPELARSLDFPIDFTGISFGDNDGWHPALFFFRLADRLDMPHAALRAAAYLDRPPPPGVKKRRTRPFTHSGDLVYAADFVPTGEQMAKLEARHAKRKAPVARVYPGLDWGVLADDEAFPALRMSVRGGSAKVAGHGMVDLLSFHCRVNGELMLTDQKDTGYLSTTFGRRGTEIYPRSAAAKSTLFVEGLGPAADATCETTEVVTGRGLAGIRIDATGIYLPRMPASFIGRLFLFVDNAYWLVIDHVMGTTHVNTLGVESRFHTYADYKRGRDRVSLRQGGEHLQMTFAAMQPGVIQQSRGMPPLPIGEQTTIFRWMGRGRVADNLHAAALTPGTDKVELAVSNPGQDDYRVKVSRPGRRARHIRLTSDLRLA